MTPNPFGTTEPDEYKLTSQGPMCDHPVLVSYYHCAETP